MSAQVQPDRPESLTVTGLPPHVRGVVTTRAFYEATQGERGAVARGLRALLGLPDAEAVFLKQVHGAAVINADDISRSEAGWTRPGEGDALFATRPGVILVARTADCVPVLIAARNASFVAAVHSGWRGTRARIVEAAISAAEQAGVPASDLTVTIGPCISGDAYEVSEELAREFDEAFTHLGRFTNGRLLDLPGLCSAQARHAGVPEAHVHAPGHCTWSRPDLLPSYRRDGSGRGEIYSAIALVPERAA